MSTIYVHPIISLPRLTGSATAQGPTSVSPLISFTRGARLNTEQLPALLLNIPHFDFLRRLFLFTHLQTRRAACLTTEASLFDSPLPCLTCCPSLSCVCSVFWDLYCAAPDRRETCEHSSEAKAFHDYVSELNQPPPCCV